MTDSEKQQLEKEFNRKYYRKIKRIEERNFIIQKKTELKRMKKQMRKDLGLTTTKLLCYYIFIIFNVVLFYALIAMWHFGDLSYLGVIISDILGQVLVYTIYSIRAYKDTKSEEDMKLKREKLYELPEKAQEKLTLLLDSMDNLTGEQDNNDISDDL